MELEMEQLNLKLLINRNYITDLDKITKLVREGWDIIHFDLCNEEECKDTKVVLTRKM
jgi:hypothetical protein